MDEKKPSPMWFSPDLVPISIVCVHAVHDWMIKFDWVYREGGKGVRDRDNEGDQSDLHHLF